MKRELTIEIPLLMTVDAGKYLIASRHLSIYIQGNTESQAKKMFEKSADMLFDKWAEQNRLISQLRAGGLLKSDAIIKDLPETSVGAIKMPPLELGHYENARVAVC